MKHIFKFLSFLCLVPALIVHHSLIFIFITNQEKRTLALISSLQTYSRLGLRILGINLIYDFDPRSVKNSLVVTNHLSYIDVLAFSSLFPAAYVTSVEIKNTPVLGQVCQLCGCIFTERRRKKRTSETHAFEIKKMVSYLQMGANIVLFPEATSTAGHSVLPFKTSLLEGAIQGRTEFRPMGISYSSPGVAWFGDMTFLPHLWQLCRSEGINAYIALGKTYSHGNDEGRKEIGVKLHLSVSALHADCNLLAVSNEQTKR